MHRGWWAIGIALLVSGCADSGDPAEATDPSGPEGTKGGDGDPPAALEDDRPQPWTVGDWWTYRVESEDPGVGSFDLTAVVAGETSEAYLLAGVSAKINATYFTHLPALGPIRKADWAVTRHSHYVPFLHFPLSEGATWEVEVRGPWTATAHRANLTVAGGAVPGWRVEYRIGESLQHVIEWSHVTGWFTKEETYFGGDTPRHSVTLVGWGTAWKGPVEVRTVQDVYVKSHAFNSSSPSATVTGAESFTVPSGADYLLVGVFIGGDTGLCGHQFVSPVGPAGETILRTCTADTQLFYGGAAPHAGEWRSVWTIPGKSGFAFVEVYAVTDEAVTLA